MNHAQLAILLLIATLGLLHAAELTDIFQANRRLGGGVNLGNYLEVPRGQTWGISIDDGHFDMSNHHFQDLNTDPNANRQRLLDSLIPRSERR